MHPSVACRVSAEQIAGGRISDHFADTYVVLHRSAVCRVAVHLRLPHIATALGLELPCGPADAGDLWRGEHRRMDIAVVEAAQAPSGWAKLWDTTVASWLATCLS